MVIKRDGSREPFDEKKLLRGVRVCTEKLAVSEAQIETLLAEVEESLNMKAGSTREIKSSVIGDETLLRLKEVNKVAYVRFAAVYRAYNDLGQFIQEIEKLGKELG